VLEGAFLLQPDVILEAPCADPVQILSFIDDPKVLARASQVSRRWRDLLSDDMTWKNLCVKHDYQRRLSTFGSRANTRPAPRSYKSHFKQRYLVDAAWRFGGRNVTRNITQDGGVVTSLHLTPKYIVVALDNARIHVFDTEGNPLRTLQGHVMGVWAMVPWDDILVSGGCDRDVRVWDLTTG
jgi:F-box and WD-40 domain protein CDC4